MIDTLTTIEGCLAAIIRRDGAIGELEQVIRRLMAAGGEDATRIAELEAELAAERDTYATWLDAARAELRDVQLVRNHALTERDRYRRDLAAMADRAVELAKRLTAAERRLETALGAAPLVDTDTTAAEPRSKES
jgi:chromosome segregation ATPase